MEQAQLPQPVFVGEVLHDRICGPPLDSLQQLHIRFVLGAPHLDIVLQLRPHKGRTEGDYPLPHPVGNPSFDASDDTVGLHQAFHPSEPLSPSPRGCSQQLLLPDTH